jgi:hypothetical protein
MSDGAPVTLPVAGPAVLCRTRVRTGRHVQASKESPPPGSEARDPSDGTNVDVKLKIHGPHLRVTILPIKALVAGYAG